MLLRRDKAGPPMFLRKQTGRERVAITNRRTNDGCLRENHEMLARATIFVMAHAAIVAAALVIGSPAQSQDSRIAVAEEQDRR
jgi:hypothetical protein